MLRRRRLRALGLWSGGNLRRRLRFGDVVGVLRRRHGRGTRARIEEFG